MSTKTKKNFRKVTSFLLATAMIIAAMASSVVSFAAADDLTRQGNSSSTATIDLEKTLTVDQAGKFPNVKNFRFTFERIKGWKNANTDTAQNGTAISDLTQIPMPADVQGSIANSGNVATVTNSDYSTAAVGDTTTARSRSTSLPITYTDAGYYVYKVDEINDGAEGVFYDQDSYYVVVYVCNNKDNSNSDTTTGVYVHSITVWQNEPDLSDITGLNAGEDIGGADPDTSSSHVSKGSNPWDTASATGKLSLSTQTNPDEITVNFDNISMSHDIVISKNVKGSLGDRTKQFEFTVTLSGLVSNTAYTLSDNVSIKGTPAKGTWDSTNSTMTSDANGDITFTCKLTDDQDIKIEGLPVGATYTVNEAASDHIASFALSSDNNAAASTYTAVEVANMDSSKTYYYKNDGTDTEVDQNNLESGTTTVYEKSANAAAAVIAQETGANTVKDTALATAQETVNRTDGTITAAYTNTRDIQTVTGVPDVMVALIAATAVLAIAGALFIAKRREFDEE